LTHSIVTQNPEVQSWALVHGIPPAPAQLKNTNASSGRSFMAGPFMSGFRCIRDATLRHCDAPPRKCRGPTAGDGKRRRVRLVER
jgi:hypothetical protein